MSWELFLRRCFVWARLTKQVTDQRSEPVQVTLEEPSIDQKSTDQKWNSKIQRCQAGFLFEYTVVAFHLSCVQSIGNDARNQTSWRVADTTGQVQEPKRASFKVIIASIRRGENGYQQEEPAKCKTDRHAY